MSIFFGKRSDGGAATTGSAATGDAAAAAPDAPPISIPLYIAGFVVQSAGLAAVAFQIGDATFAAFTIGLTALGTAVSYVLRRVGTPTRLLKSGTFLLGLIFLYALRGAGIFGALVPPEEIGSQEMLLVSALAFTATFASFLLITDDAVIFTCVWAIAMIGLTGTVNINRELPICFVVFLGAASFLLVHQNALTFGGAGAATERDPRPGGLLARLRLPMLRWRLLRTHLLMAGAAWITALLLGVLIAIPVQMVGRNMSLGTIIQRLKVPPAPVNRNVGGQRLIFDNPNQFNVGLGPVDDDPTERLSVWSDRPQYWRGRTYDEYNGRGWNSSFMERRATLEVPPETVPAANDYFTLDVAAGFRDSFGEQAARAKTARIVNTYRVSAGTYGPIYHAAEPQLLRAPMMRVFLRPDHTMAGGRGMSTDYEVESEVTEAKPSDLRRSSTAYPEDITSQYLGVGPYYSEALRELSEEATDGFDDNPYDKASAIRRFVASRCLYTREASAVPRDRDAAEYFLNESREGYCDLYATAMVLLARYAGLPARIATGFAPGLPLEDDQEPKPGGPNDKRTRYVLRGSDLHSWAEVYFAGYGWVVFDATIDTGGTTPAPRTPEPTEERSSPLSGLRRALAPILLVSLGVLAAAFAIWNELRGRRGGPARGATLIAPGERNAGAVYQVYDAAARRLSRKGLRRPGPATTGEYLERVRAVFGPDAGAAFEPLTRLTEKALYGPSGITEADVREAKEARGRLEAALKQAPRYRPEKNAEEEADADVFAAR